MAEGNRYADLAGVEGVYLIYLLERGIVGLLFYVLFYATIVFWLYRNRKWDVETAALGISSVSGYLVFAVMTGELSAVPPTLLVAGMCIRLLYTAKKECLHLTY